jgi:hypothetical protein
MLDAVSNRLDALTPLVPEILTMLPSVVTGQIYRIPAPAKP